MQIKISPNTLIGQEKRAINLFVIILLSIIFMADLLIAKFFISDNALIMLSPYYALFLLIPLVFILVKKRKPVYIKYIFFTTYVFVNLVIDIIVFWGETEYQGGSVAEMFFILFSPIFVNKRYYWIVSIGVLSRYVLTGVILQNTEVIWSMLLTLVFAIVSFIILNRFIGYIVALNDSYNQQFEETLSTGMTIMNHTIKNEITKIQYLNSRIKTSITNIDIPDVIPMMNSIYQATEHMLNMSNRLQSKTGEINLLLGTFNLVSIIKSAVGMIEPNLQKNNIQCIQEFKCDVNMVCDKLQLQEALMNILVNAVESMDTKEGSVTIRLLCKMKNVVIEIEDTGCGIPSDIRTHIFEPFFTTRSTLTNHGLGLNYSNNVVLKHDGLFEIHSEVNVGTKVLIYLPQHRITQIHKKDN